MHKFFLMLTVGLLSMPLLGAACLFLAIEAQPRVKRPIIVAPEHIERAKQIIDMHRDQASSAKLATARILAQDADIAANYLVNHFAKGNAQVDLADRYAHIHLSLPIPFNIINGYLNLEIILIQSPGLPRLWSVQIGNLSLPDFVTNLLVSKCIDWLQQSPDFRAGIDSIKQVHLTQQEVNIVYNLKKSFSEKKNSISLLSKKEQLQLFRYHLLLIEHSQQQDKRRIPLSQVLPPLMNLAAKQSASGDAIAENRAAILAATFHVLGIPLKQLVPEAANWPQAVSQDVTIDGRDDFAKHFMVSAAITAYTDTILSDAIGLYKEIEDARSGSGFSFNDLAADRAGTRFGEKAVASQNSARQLQQLVAAGLRDSDLMPPWSDLPELMSEKEFKQRFGGIGAPAYQQMMAEIEKRVSALRVLH